MREKDQQPTRQWRLALHQDQIWAALPESTQASCWDLLVQLRVESSNHKKGGGTMSDKIRRDHLERTAYVYVAAMALEK